MSNPADLGSTTITGGGSNSYGYDRIGFIIDGTYVSAVPEPEVLTYSDVSWWDNWFREHGTSRFSFELQMVDKAINKNDATSAIKSLWDINQTFWHDNYYKVNDPYLKNKMLNFSLADSIQQRINASNKEALELVAKSKEFESTAYNIVQQELSGGAFTPIKAMSHYLWGKGAKLSVDINKINLDIKPNELPLLKSSIEHTKSPGTYHISETHVPYNTMDDSYTTGLYLGRITLKSEGDFQRFQDGSWKYTGSVKAYNDIFDFNASDRPFIFEQLTNAGRGTGGKPYEIEIHGQHNIEIVGSGYVIDPTQY
ncbi:TPA: lipid II-degrading bacteriocin [Pseudomonas aeruginosa]|uniref:lipid II-degrading bacteriocin n=1 Tax=Pseudomonas aeruginosa TaxID=287 RepID=UPI0021AF4831|nr:lipid II-degrading bacteriocin [Pseudomonas aeruginosa]HCF2499750.1 lipid II-degrading bacteriocin [Pseudomonas aeruginosa]HCF2907307.1 lipid II-degrading bacteriocin [Pseudomonas aeruginosa]HDQ4745382.1 lipid II-degrading bacteriocin [Pseudomonas aeruginosa]